MSIDNVKKYAKVDWCAEDVIALGVGQDMTDEEANTFLRDSEEDIKDVMIRAASDAIADYLVADWKSKNADAQ